MYKVRCWVRERWSYLWIQEAVIDGWRSRMMVGIIVALIINIVLTGSQPGGPTECQPQQWVMMVGQKSIISSSSSNSRSFAHICRVPSVYLSVAIIITHTMTTDLSSGGKYCGRAKEPNIITPRHQTIILRCNHYRMSLNCILLSCMLPFEYARLLLDWMPTVGIFGEGRFRT